MIECVLREEAISKCALKFLGWEFPKQIKLPSGTNATMTASERVFWLRLLRLPLFQQMPFKERYVWSAALVLDWRKSDGDFGIPEAAGADFETYDAVSFPDDDGTLKFVSVFVFNSDPAEALIALVDTLMQRCYPLNEDGSERYPLADDYLSGRDTNKHELGLEALSVRCALHRKFGLLPVLRKRRHALLHYLTRPGAADDVKELQALVNVNFNHWPVSLMEMD